MRPSRSLRARKVALVFLAFLCACSDEAVGPALGDNPPLGQNEVDVRNFGANPDDNIDDTNGFSAAVRSLPPTGGSVIVSPGVYLLSASEKDHINRAIELAGLSNITVIGAGAEQTILRMAPGAYKADTHVILVDQSTGITIKNLTIDGNRANVAYNDEQSHGVEVHASNTIRFEGVLFTGLHGDGIRLLGLLGPTPRWVENVVVESCSFENNGRSGIAIQRAVRGLTVNGNSFTRISDQAIDMEPTGGSQGIAPRDFTITNNRFFDTASLSLTITGLSIADPARNILVADNELDATGIFVFNARDVRIERNVIRSGSQWAPIEVRKGSENVWIVGNDIDSRATQKAAIVMMFHTSRAPKDIHVVDNTIRTADYGAFYSRDTESVSITGNKFAGIGAYGIMVQDISPGSPLSRFLIEDNELEGFDVGVSFVSRGDAATDVCVRRNEFINIETELQMEGPIGSSCLGF